MNRFVAIGVFAIVVLAIGASVVSISAQSTSTAPDSSNAPHLAGKFVIIERDGWYIGVKANVRFASLGNKAFIVCPMDHSDGESYDYWMPLESVNGLKVFERLEEATAHDKRTSPNAKDR
jgi:hypothetical protein